ncbi:hypothetical protein Tco_1030163 [Tanacetum coccineum]|uniref:Reverse transcriptase Ty1/copia-type domain-containing protein n=1 Tax=Tanacetum coccineum TaxID=301880 RepID=A0ABQ5G5G6_9ASTR
MVLSSILKFGLVSVNTARQVNAAHTKTTVNGASLMLNLSKTAHSTGNPQQDLQEKGVINNGCSRHMTGNMSYLTDFEEIYRGYVAFGGNPKEGKITSRGKLNGDSIGKDYICYIVDEDLRKDSECNDQEKEDNDNVNTVSSTVNAAGTNKDNAELPDDQNKPALEDYSIFDSTSDDQDDGDHTLDQVFGDLAILHNTNKKVSKIRDEFYGELTFFLGLQVQQKKDGIFISQDKYVGEILKKFGFTEVKTASTPMETQKPLLKDEDGEEVDVHMYRSMIGSLMYLTSLRPDIMFVVCACARYQVNPKVSHLHDVKRIFRYLKGQPKLGLWYPKDSPFDLVAYTDSDYAGASLDRKSTTGGCQFLRSRLISWQCKKHIVVLNSTTKAKYMAASSCCGQVLWIQNQLLEYGHNLLLLLKVNAARHNLLLLLKVNAARHKLTRGINLLLLLKVNAARHNLQLLVNCIEQCWATVKVKTVNGEVQLQAVMDGRKIIVTDASVRRDLQLNDKEGTDCLPNAIICLATNQKFNFSKYIFKSMATVKVKTINGEVQLQALVDGKKIIITESIVKRDLQLEDAEDIDCLSNSTIFEQLTLMGVKTTAWNEFSSTMASAIICLATNQKFNFSKYIFESMVKNLENVSGGGPRCQETMGDTIAQTRFENVSKTSNVSLLLGVNTSRSDKDRLKLNELMEFCTKLQQRVLELENTKTAQAQEITSLKLRVKRLEKKGGSRTHKLKRLYKVGRSAKVISSDEASLGVLDDEEVFAGQDMAEKEINVAEKEVSMANPVTTVGEVVTTASVEISTASPTETIIADDLTLAHTLIEIKIAKPKVKGVVIEEQSESTTRIRPQQLPSKDKAKLEEEDRLVRQREEEANIVSWDNVQAMIDADYQMAQQMQAEEQERLSIKEKSKLFVQFLEARKKHFAAMRAQEKSNKPPTKAQKRKTMSTYLKNMDGYKHNQLKNKSFDDIQKLFDKAIKRVDEEEELVLNSKSNGVCVIANEEEVALDAIPLAVNSPSIVDWKIHKEGKKSYY